MPEAGDAQASPCLPARGTLLGFDFGLARIGVALGELETGHACALETIHAESNHARFSAINASVEKWQPVALVTGVPHSLEGEDQALSKRCRRFANQLRGRYGLPVFEQDERLSSMAAAQLLHEAGLRNWRAQKQHLDAMAAQIILQNFLDQRRYDSH